MMLLYDYPDSGNSYKPQLLFSNLDLKYQLIELDIIRGETQTEEFKKISPLGKIPVLILEDGNPLWESNAILGYLAEGTEYLPDDPYLKAQVYQWMFFEQYYHEPNVAVMRFMKRHLNWNDTLEEKSIELLKKGNMALAQMEDHLEGNDFFVGNKYSIADIALFAYTHVADQGGFNLSDYPNIQKWIASIEAQKGFKPMKAEIL